MDPALLAAVLLAQAGNVSELSGTVGVLRDVGVLGAAVIAVLAQYSGKVTGPRVVTKEMYDAVVTERDSRVPREQYDAEVRAHGETRTALRKRDELVETRVIPALVDSNRLLQAAEARARGG